MGYGLYDNDHAIFVETEWLEEGLWLESDGDSGLFAPEDARIMWIIPNETPGTSEIEGPDNVKYVAGPHKGEYVEDVLNEICRQHDGELDPRNWDVDWTPLGLMVVSDCLKRWSPQDGYYHA